MSQKFKQFWCWLRTGHRPEHRPRRGDVFAVQAGKPLYAVECESCGVGAMGLPWKNIPWARWGPFGP